MWCHGFVCFRVVLCLVEVVVEVLQRVTLAQGCSEVKSMAPVVVWCSVVLCSVVEWCGVVIVWCSVWSCVIWGRFLCDKVCVVWGFVCCRFVWSGRVV